MRERSLIFEHGGLDAVHARVPAEKLVVVFRGLAVIAESAHFCREGGVVCHCRAGVTKGAEIFAGIKTEAADVAEGAGLSARLYSAPWAWCGVFDNEEAMLAGEGEDRVHIRRLAVQMHMG